jgi:hypothetical protein
MSQTAPSVSLLCRRLFLDKLAAAHAAGRLQFFGDHAHLAEARAFAAFLKPLRKTKWFVYAKRPFAGPQSRYTHRVAISNRRLISADDKGVTFKVKDYRIEGPGRYKTMTLATDEFIRRFLIHVLPKGLHRIRHYGVFANGGRADNIARIRHMLDGVAPQQQSANDHTADAGQPQTPADACPCCGGRMIVIETFEPGAKPSYRPTTPTIDTS